MEETEEQVLGSNVPVMEPISFVSCIRQNALAFQAERHRGLSELDGRGRFFRLFADGGGIKLRQDVEDPLALAQETQQQVFGLDFRRAELAGFVAREENHSARFLRVSLKHRLLHVSYSTSLTRQRRPCGCCASSTDKTARRAARWRFPRRPLRDA